MFKLIIGKYTPYIFVGLFFAGLLATGLCIHRDYGLCWDDENQRRIGGISALYVNSKLNYLFVSKDAVPRFQEERQRNKMLAYGMDSNESPVNYYDGRSLLWDIDSDHGAFFELILIAAEWLLDLVEPQNVYFMRHLLTFLTFYVGVIFFYMLLHHRFRSWKISLLGCLFLVVSPRIFAHSFYNSKDLAFLSVYIISSYTLVRFLEKKNLRNALSHALATAILIDIRIPGIIVPAVTFVSYGIDIAQRETLRGFLKRHTPVLAAYSLFLISFVILFWPYLWENPLRNFIQAFVSMSHYWNDATMLYLGTHIKASNTPWHYLLVWILITTPVLYTTGFLAGFAALTYDFLRNPRSIFLSEDKKQDYVLLSLCLLPLVAVIALGSTVYDGWRQLFFVYPAFLYISTRGFWECRDQAINRLRFIDYRFLQIIAVAILLVGVGKPLWFMVKYHPFQNVYFSFLAGDSIEHKFERDYWGLSYRQGLEHILEIDKDDIVKVCPSNRVGKYNAQIVGKKARRLRFVPLEEAKYFMTNYRGMDPRLKGEVPGWKEVFSIKVDELRIMGVYARN